MKDLLPIRMKEWNQLLKNAPNGDESVTEKCSGNEVIDGSSTSNVPVTRSHRRIINVCLVMIGLESLALNVIHKPHLHTMFKPVSKSLSAKLV